MAASDQIRVFSIVGGGCWVASCFLSTLTLTLPGVLALTSRSLEDGVGRGLVTIGRKGVS